jgi:hypothetical protein
VRAVQHGRAHLTVRLTPPSEKSTSSVRYFLGCVNELFEYALRNSIPKYIVGISIHDEVKQDRQKLTGCENTRSHQGVPEFQNEQEADGVL